VFGRKDAQQLAVIRQMALDLSFPVDIEGAPTVRAPDGVAMSSRNALLGDDDRARARSISFGLFAACDAVEAGERSAQVLESVVRSTMVEVGVDAEYVALADARRAVPVATLEDESFLAVAARVGPVRLIDNVFLWPDGSTDRGVSLEGLPMPGRS
jgi:pantoate--beta-alanine ligase